MPNLLTTVSPDRSIKVVADWPGHTITWTKSGKKTLSRKWEPLGHHPALYVTNDGVLAIVDAYAGVQMFDMHNRTIDRTDAQLIRGISPQKRLHQWTCHPEGEWLNREVTPVIKGETISITDCTGRLVTVRLREAATTKQF
jgi:hypothetical protein